eukprot:TRINITY_DN6495_c2_g1_i2.p1 TRINITY_DN6495_c2_g1~~TRINITY_DN6495_c2_g1_i2.p1  ORF type:complete len:271 (+),score=56.40 TRINITY_DN6495_c2_g1_i2:821-1633(+)
MAMLNQSLDDLIKERKSNRLSGGRGGRGGKGSRGRSNSRGRGGSGGTFGGRGRIAGGGQATLRPRFSGYRVSPYANAARFQGRGRGGGRSNVQRVQQRRVMPKNKVFVTNLPFDWEEGDILHVMETVGEVEKLTIFWDPQGRPTGSALVAYANDVKAHQAIQELNGAKLGNNEITVSSAKGDQQGGGGGGGGGKAARGGKGTKGWNQGGSKTQPAQGGGGKGRRQFGQKAGRKGGKKGKKGAKRSSAKVERKEVKAEDLDNQLAAFVANA